NTNPVLAQNTPVQPSFPEAERFEVDTDLESKTETTELTLKNDISRAAEAAPREDGRLSESEETTFVVDEVSNIVKEAIESAIGGNAYQHSKVNQWTTNVVEQTLSQLTKLGKPFKYIVTCIIMQKNGAGLHTASSCFWDSSTDGSCTVRWENKTMYCIVSAFGLSI
ncbi:hypothetical protein QTO34_018618, partial [Cnephaeus nilssonii]